ncbi:MAG TPA: PAS domain-containing protein [Stellaceae bacterium]|nr:PAS domain-containing protein [Stellaceae bacterium]
MTSDGRRQDETPWPRGTSQADGQLRRFDWTSTYMGPLADWPESRRAVIDLIMATPFPMASFWGPEALMIYNDAYVSIAGPQHPGVFGMSVFEGWPELAGFNRNVMERCFYRGETLSFHEQQLEIEREGFAETRWLSLYYSPIRDAAGTIEGVLAVARDVTTRVHNDQRRQQAEEMLRDINDGLESRVVSAIAERQLLADIVEGSSDPIAVLDQQFRYMAFNKAYRDNLHQAIHVAPGLPSPLAVGRSFDQVWAGAPRARDARRPLWERALSGEEFEATFDFADIGHQSDEEDPENLAYFDITFRTLRDRAGVAIGAFMHCRDVSTREKARLRLLQAEEALRQSQKMEAVGQLTGGIAHDFNNLLGGILGALEMLERRIAQGRLEDLGRYSRIASASAERAAALTQRLLAFARRQPLDPKPVDANALLSSMEDLLSRTLGPGVILEIVAGKDLWTSLCDENQLENAILNLTINARDAMPDGGRLTIETANALLDSRAKLHHGEVRPGPYVAISITDTGCGMSSDVLAHAFEPFYTTKPTGQGTGLGLSQLYGFVKQSGGHVHIHSEVGFGTTVHVYLPRYQAPPEFAESETSAQPINQKGAGEKVLVVEDEPALRQVMIDALRDMSYEPIEAADADVGLAVLQSDQEIDLLLTDVGLPGAMNGRQMADAARFYRPGLKVLFITGYAHRSSLEEGSILDPGMEVLPKPFALDRLIAKIREMLRSDNHSEKQV